MLRVVRSDLTSQTERERERKSVPSYIYTHVSNIHPLMAFRRGGLILTWTVDVAFFSASPCGLPQNLGGSGGLGGGPF